MHISTLEAQRRQNTAKTTTITDEEYFESNCGCRDGMENFRPNPRHQRVRCHASVYSLTKMTGRTNFFKKSSWDLPRGGSKPPNREN